MDTRWSVLKVQHADWIRIAVESLTEDMVQQSFELAGIPSTENDIEADAIVLSDEDYNMENGSSDEYVSSDEGAVRGSDSGSWYDHDQSDDDDFEDVHEDIEDVHVEQKQEDEAHVQNVQRVHRAPRRVSRDSDEEWLPSGSIMDELD